VIFDVLQCCGGAIMIGMTPAQASDTASFAELSDDDAKSSYLVRMESPK